MLDRKLAAVGLLAVLSVVWFAGTRTVATGAAPAAQIDIVRGALHAGTCRNAEPRAIVQLGSFTRSGAPTDAAAPLLSYTDAPVALSDLLDSPHTMLITVGGDRAALLACGDIRGSAAAPTISVDLSEFNDSGLSGIALLIATAGGVQISVILDEAVDDGPAATPLTGPQGTPAVAGSPTAVIPVVTPVIEEPSPTAPSGFPLPTPAWIPGGPTPTPVSGAPTPVSGDLTPTAVTGGPPEVPIFLPPVAQVTPAATEVPPTAVGPTPGTYTSQEFGYAVVIPAGWEMPEPPRVEAGFDQVILSNGVGRLVITGDDNPLTAPECIDNHYELVRAMPNLSLLTPHSGPDAALTTRAPERAVEVWDVVLLGPQGEPVTLTLYVECRVLVPGQSVLLLTHESTADTYYAQTPVREEVYGGLTMP